MPDASGRSSPKNGRASVPLAQLAIAAEVGAAGAVYDDPMSKVLGLDAQSSGPVRWLVYTLAAIALMLGMAVTARIITVVLESMNAQAVSAALPPQEIDVMREEPPPPPPPPPEAKPEEAKPEPAPPPPAVRAVAHEAPPAPAQAAKVLAQEPDPNEPVDLTGNTIVQGNAESYAGGTTASNGTSTRAVRNLASAVGVPNGTGTADVKPAGPDRSRPATPVNTDWNAPFPPESDTAQIDETYVTLQIDVRPDGSVSTATVLADPGYGFGREARKYALTQRFNPAFDRDGNPIPIRTKVKVHFSR